MCVLFLFEKIIGENRKCDAFQKSVRLRLDHLIQIKQTTATVAAAKKKNNSYQFKCQGNNVQLKFDLISLLPIPMPMIFVLFDFMCCIEFAAAVDVATAAVTLTTYIFSRFLSKPQAIVNVRRDPTIPFMIFVFIFFYVLFRFFFI